MAAKPTSGPLGVLQAKKGPLPVWGWFVVGLLVYWLYKRFAAGSSSAAQSSPVSVGTGTSPVPIDTGGGTASSGQGSPADNMTADLLSQQLGYNAQINSNLVTGLLGATSSVEGLGYGAFSLAAQSNQALVDLTTGRYAAPTIQYIVQPTTQTTLAAPSPSPSSSSNSPAAYSGYTVAPYYSTAGQSEGAGPVPAAGGASYSLGTLRGAGYGRNQSING